MSSILFIGRFQPFHKGHLWAIQKILTSNGKKVLIGIGSAQHHHTSQNPFGIAERIQMIEAGLKENKIKKNQYTIIPIPDIGNDPQWPAHVRRLVKEPFETLYTGRPIVKKLFEKYDSVNIVFLPRFKNISATQVRRKIKKNDNSWRTLVPKAVATIIDQIDGVKRIKVPGSSTDKSSSREAAGN